MGKDGCPCKGCEIRLIGCHGLCQKYQQWKKDMEKKKAATKEEKPELSKSMKRHVWRKMLGR